MRHVEGDRIVEEARAAAAVLDGTGQKEMAHTVAKLADKLVEAHARERVWRLALVAAIQLIDGKPME